MTDRDYFELRAAVEDRLAIDATDSRAAAAHAELALAYRARLPKKSRPRR